MKDSMKFRFARIEDLEAIVDIYNSTIPSRLVTADTSPVSVESRVEWFHKHTPNKRPLWVIEDENMIVGWVAFHSFYGRPAYDGTVEVSIYLHEKIRGKGIGKKVLEFAIEQGLKLNVKTLLGYIFAHNEPSIKLFEKFGFKEWAHLPDIAELDGIERSVKILGLRIA
jgi:L-amino acid N-acyltransferase YncA